MTWVVVGWDWIIKIIRIKTINIWDDDDCDDG